PFTFYRGAAYVMASDLAMSPRSGIRAQLCGDAHLSNFGAFGTPERRLILDINDFHETRPRALELDVKRLAASTEGAARDGRFGPSDREAIVIETVHDYRTAMRSFAQMQNLDVWYASLDVGAMVDELRSQIDPKRIKVFEKSMAKARTRDSTQAYEKLTVEVDGERRIISDPPLIVPIEDLATDIPREKIVEQVRSMVRGYRRTLETDRRHLLEQYRLVHLAHKVVGVGSVGSRAWIILMLGR